MNITPEMVRDLREKTGAGMMDCKGALTEANGDMDAAFELLRKKGVALAAKKSSRTASDGLIGSFVNPEESLAVLVEVNCETDFVTKTEDFQKFVTLVTNAVRDGKPANLEGLMSSTVSGKTVEQIKTEAVAKIGENIGVRRFSRVETNGAQKLAQYIHAGSKIGVVVVYDDPNKKLDTQTAREVAMHVAAMHPQYVRKQDVPEQVVAKEKEIMLAQMGDMKKPPEILEKIVGGKIGKFFTEVCLDEQVFVRDPDGKTPVAKWLEKIDAQIKIRSFTRLQVGEGIEKKS